MTPSIESSYSLTHVKGDTNIILLGFHVFRLNKALQAPDSIDTLYFCKEKQSYLMTFESLYNKAIINLEELIEGLFLIKLIKNIAIL